MNKVFCGKRLLFSLFLTGYLILFNTACGLDTFYVIDSPKVARHTPDCTSIDYSDSYFEFDTVDYNYESIKFLGTDVYYKIYKSSNTLLNEVNTLINLSSTSDTSNNAANRLIESYRYSPLRGAGYDGVNVLIPTSGSNQTINIRLSDYQDIYPAQITVDGSNIYGSASRVIPVRNLSTKPSFNFKTLTPDLRPTSEDADVNSNGSGTGTEWYVSMFAVAIGQDATYSPVYSNILYLGSVRIPTE